MIQIWHNDLSPEIEQEIIRKKASGVNVLCILYDETGQYQTKIPNVFHHGFEDSKLAEAARWLTIASDNDIMLHMSIVNGENFHAIYTGNSSLTYFAREYILHDDQSGNCNG